jgi:hypothetical protein
MSVIVFIITMDVKTQINCQVGTVLFVCSSLGPDHHNFKFWALFSNVGTLSYTLFEERTLIDFFVIFY